MMAPRLRRLGGRELVRILVSLGFEVASTRGSHLKLVRLGGKGERQVLTIPMHRDLAPGTVRAVFRQAGKYLPEGELRRHFYS